MGFKRQTANSLKNDCLEYLKTRGVLAWRQNNVGVWDPVKQVFRRRSAVKGVPDILGILPGGVFLACEVKVGKDRLSPEQQAFIDNANRQGGLALVARCLDDLIAAVEKALDSERGG
jgi:hypothetical protein